MTTQDTNKQDNTEQEYHRERVEKMITTAKTKAELQDLVRSLDARNMQLQHINRALQHQLHQHRKDTP
ncbi:putative FlaG/YvyC family protein [Kocuria rhizophila]|uniref:hypothetical protein n=1 Tax=Kocuria rhizophila TaxID=72000 RepID=UPI00285EB1A9|nr:hypothetical protein [Kocuria rhizophila]MDR7375311.1 putative FlaG/YvyC family protein [Kocuria rhizophila]